MEEEPTTSAGLAKRARAELEAEKKEISLSTRVDLTWKYIESLKNLQRLELEIEQEEKKLRLAENRFPDLKNLRGNVDHLAEGKFWEVEDDGKKRIISGKSLKEAEEKYRKKAALEKANKEKQKKNLGTKNQTEKN